MKRVMLAAAAASMLCVLTPASAPAQYMLPPSGACAQLIGARWLYYMEGAIAGYPSMSTGIVDVRLSLTNGSSLKTVGRTPFPALTQSMTYGQSTISRITGCQALAVSATIPANTAQLSDLSGVSARWTVSTDGRSATIRGANATEIGMTGRALRLP